VWVVDTKLSYGYDCLSSKILIGCKSRVKYICWLAVWSQKQPGSQSIPDYKVIWIWDLSNLGKTELRNLWPHTANKPFERMNQRHNNHINKWRAPIQMSSRLTSVLTATVEFFAFCFKRRKVMSSLPLPILRVICHFALHCSGDANCICICHRTNLLLIQVTINSSVMMCGSLGICTPLRVALYVGPQVLAVTSLVGDQSCGDELGGRLI
jgi:hypothetical protein